MRKKILKNIVFLLCVITFCLTITSISSINVKADTSLTPIMGQGTLNKNQMINSLINRNNKLTVREICDFVDNTIKEANIEGVNYDILFSQMMLETNYLNYGGDVQASQNNFAGLGATGGGNPGHSFESVQIGIRAVVQHLKAYASTEALKQRCVDPRFQYVTRGTAIYVEYLGQKENPTGAGWATAEGYGQSILNILSSVSKFSIEAKYVLVSELSLSNSKYTVDNPFTIYAKGTDDSKTLYKIMICNRSTGEWITLSNWSTIKSTTYTPKNSGDYRIVVYVKHSEKTLSIEDDYKYIDINVLNTKSKLSSVNITGDNYVKSTISINAIASPTNETLYKIMAVDRSTGVWATLSNWSSKNTSNYIPQNPGTHRIVVYVKHSTKTGDIEDDYYYKDLTINEQKSKLSSVSITGDNYVKSTISINAIASPTNETLYKIMAVDRSTGVWATLSNWSSKNTSNYIPQNPGTHRIVVYVKHSSKTGDIEDDYYYKDLTINEQKSKLSSVSITGDNYVKSTISINAIASPTNETLYKIMAVDRSTGVWATLSNWSSKNTSNYIPQNPGTHRIVVYVKHSSKTGDVEDDYYYDDLNVIQPIAKVSKLNVDGELKANSTLKISATATSGTSTLYKIYLADRSTGVWTVLSDWSNKNSIDYIPIHSGEYRVLVYVKHSTKNSDVEDDYSFKDIFVAQKDKSKVSTFNLSGSKVEGGTINLNVTSNLPSETLYKLMGCNRRTGQWFVLRDWGTITTASYTLPEGGDYTFVAYVKHNTKYSSEEDDYSVININATYTHSYISNFYIEGSNNVGSTITMKASASPSGETLYKFMVCDRSTGKWVTVKDWSNSNTATYTPVSSGTHRFIVYVKHEKNASNTVEDSYKYLDITVGSRGIIVIDPGHGGSDPGAIGNGYLEKNGTLAISLKLKSKLEAMGYVVYITRSNDTYVDLYDRARLANNVKADLQISIHHNSFNTTSTGVEVLYSSNKMDSSIRDEVLKSGWPDPNNTYSSKLQISKQIASDLSANLSTALGLTNRGAKDQNLAVNRNTAMPSILVEAGFISNPNDCNIVMTSSGQDKIVNSIANIVSKYI